MKNKYIKLIYITHIHIHIHNLHLHYFPIPVIIIHLLKILNNL